VVWLDGLTSRWSVFFDAGFAENNTSKSQKFRAPKERASRAMATTLAPMRHEARFGATSPIFSYPTRAAGKRWNAWSATPSG